MNQLQLLHKLVHSLNKGEKKLFTHQVEKQQFKQDKYFYTLYKILEQQAVYDESSIESDYLVKTKKKDLVDDKNYLQEQLLRCIATTSTDDNIELYILQHIIKIRSLENKGHIELAIKCIKQAIKLCEETENFILLLRCLNIEQSFYPYLHDNTDKTIEAQHKYNGVLEALLCMNKMDTIVLEISKIFENNTKKSIPTNKKAILSLLDQLPALKQLHYHRQKASYHHIHFAAYYQLGDYKKAYAAVVQALDEMDENIYYIYEDRWMYITAQINAAHNAFKLDKHKQVDEHFSKIDEVIAHALFKTNSSFIIEAKKLRISHQLIIYLFQKNYSSIIRLEQEAIYLFSNSATSTYFTKPRNMNICFAIASIASGEIDKAYYWAMEEIKNTNSREYEVYTFICYTIKLIYAIEHDMLDMFDSEYLSAIRYVRNKSNFTKTDKLILKLLDKIKVKSLAQEHKKEIQRVIGEFDVIKDQYLYHYIISYFNSYL